MIAAVASPGRISALLLLALLAGCAGSGEAPSAADTATAPAESAPVPESCPATLAYVKDKLVTPYDELEKFIGPEELDRTLNESIDERIVKGGGLDASIAGVQAYIKEYKTILSREPDVRDELKKEGMSDDWIATYFLTVEDGVTINQAFLDAAKCRQARLQQGEAPPAG